MKSVSRSVFSLCIGSRDADRGPSDPTLLHTSPSNSLARLGWLPQLWPCRLHQQAPQAPLEGRRRGWTPWQQLSMEGFCWEYLAESMVLHGFAIKYGVPANSGKLCLLSLRRSCLHTADFTSLEHPRTIVGTHVNTRQQKHSAWKSEVWYILVLQHSKTLYRFCLFMVSLSLWAVTLRRDMKCLHNTRAFARDIILRFIFA